MDGTTLLWLSFLAGIYAPVGSPCVIVLYPGYIAFLAGMGDEKSKVSPLSLGIMVATGLILSLLIGGILFSLLVQVTGGAARVVITPAAYLLLACFSVLLLLDIDLLPSAGIIPFPVPRAGTPYGAAFLLGLLFGVIILPCNAAVILVLLALATTASGAAESMGVFLAFGIGMTLPLLLIAGISRFRSRQVMAFLSRHRLMVRRIAGLIMLLIAAGYLVLFYFSGVFR
ncbi:MAG: cytochrome c biogenesis protein CcdA [Methanomicrobiales archaeon]